MTRAIKLLSVVLRALAEGVESADKPASNFIPRPDDSEDGDDLAEPPDPRPRTCSRSHPSCRHAFTLLTIGWHVHVSQTIEILVTLRSFHARLGAVCVGFGGLRPRISKAKLERSRADSGWTVRMARPAGCCFGRFRLIVH